MHWLALVVLVGCADIPTYEPFEGELVITELGGIIDLDVSGSTVRWTTNSSEGSQLHVSTFSEHHPVIAPNVPSIGTTTANLLVDGDTVYVTDNFGVMTLIDGHLAQVVKDDFVGTLALDADHQLVWGHVGVVSWREAGVADAFIPSISNIEDLVDVGDRIYATTRTVRANGLHYGSLYRIDKASRTATVVAHAPQFSSEFDAVSDEQLSCGVYAIGDRVYWCVEGEQGLVSGPRKILVDVDGLRVVLDPQPVAGTFIASEGTLYWTADLALWSVTPGDEPTQLLTESGIGRIETIVDGYAYGVRVSPYPGELQVRRVPIP